MKVSIYDSTLRDGAQGENISFSLTDKINITKALDEFGIDYIEAGNPYSNPKDVEYFKKISEIEIKHAKIVAFGSTRRKNADAENDKNLIALKETPVETVAIFGKSWDYHVTDILNTTLEENLHMISDSVSYLVRNGKEVFYDAEHFFDGYKANPQYAIKTLLSATNAGCKYITLCDTNGGCFPHEIEKIVSEVKLLVDIPLSIHCHNDTGCGVANSISAIRAGANQVQGTFTGIGERCGNANLSTVIANLTLKMGIDCIPEDKISCLTDTARYISEIANISLAPNMPYVGKSAFAHKGGMHVDAVKKATKSFEHINPADVGNSREFLLSEVAGRNAILSKVQMVAPEITKDSDELSQILEMLKIQEYKGYYYEAAQASFEILVLKFLGRFKEFFHVEFFKIIGEQTGGCHKPSSAIVKVVVGDKSEIGADEGDGPVNALDKALRTALSKFYPDVINKVALTDYKVRVIDTTEGTGSTVRVLIESTDGESTWVTVGTSCDIINASMKALIDSIEYRLFKEKLM